MVDEVKRKYAVALQEGRTEDATRLAQQLRSDEVSESDDVDFTDLNGVGSELADELRESFDDFSDLAETDREVLLDISGVGESRADSLIEQSKER